MAFTCCRLCKILCSRSSQWGTTMAATHSFTCHVIIACLNVFIQALCLQPNLLHNWCFTSLEEYPGIGSLPGSMVLPVMHIGRVQEDIGLRIWHIKFWQMAVTIPSDWLVSFRVLTELWLGCTQSSRQEISCLYCYNAICRLPHDSTVCTRYDKAPCGQSA